VSKHVNTQKRINNNIITTETVLQKYNNLQIVASNYVTLCDTLSYSLNALSQATHCIIGSDYTSGTRRVVTAFII